MFHVSKKTKCLRDSVFCLVSSYCMISAQSKSSLDGSLQVNRLFQVIRFTQVYRITTHGPVAHGGPDKSGANCTLLCKDTVKARQRACNSKYTQLKKAQLEGACSSDANCPLLKDGGGTGGLRHPPPASRWKHPPRPFLFFHLSYFFPVNVVLLKVVQSGRVENRHQRDGPCHPQRGTSRTIFTAFTYRLLMKWGDVFCSLKGRGSGTTTVLLPFVHGTGQLLNETMFPH